MEDELKFRFVVIKALHIILKYVMHRAAKNVTSDSGLYDELVAEFNVWKKWAGE